MIDRRSNEGVGFLARPRLRRAVASGLIAIFIGLPGAASGQEPPAAPPAAPPDAAPTPGTARLSGRILRADGKSAEPGAVIRVCSLETGAAVGSAVANARGEFEIEGVSHGFVEVTVTAGESLFVANQVVQLAPVEKKSLEFVLVPAGEAITPGSRSAAAKSVCADRPSSGSAEVRPGAAGFLRRPAGIALAAGAGVAVLLLLTAGGGDDEPPVSPSSPTR